MTMDWKTWAIDEQSVEEDEYTWKEMYRKQLVVPAMLGVWVVATVYLAELSGWWVAGMVGLWLYSCWPAYASYTHMKREERDHA